MTICFISVQAEIKIPDDMLTELNLKPGDTVCLEIVDHNRVQIRSPSVVLKNVRHKLLKLSAKKATQPLKETTSAKIRQD